MFYFMKSRTAATFSIVAIFKKKKIMCTDEINFLTLQAKPNNMKMYSFRSLLLLALVTTLCTLWSCTKEKVSTPVSQQSDALSSDEALQPGENIVETVTPGIYVITKDIHNGDDNTAAYAGYTFQFNSDGTLVASESGSNYGGKWRTNDAETKMALVTKGTPELLQLAGNNWGIAKLTDHSIILKRKGPDKVVFKMQ
jgi:hypothetical protein